MPEVERVCDRVGIIRDGHLATVADIGELKAHATRRIELHFQGPAPARAFADLPGVRESQAHGEVLSLSLQGPVDAVIKEAALHTVVNIETREPSLEDLFLSFFGRGGASPDEGPEPKAGSPDGSQLKGDE